MRNSIARKLVLMCLICLLMSCAQAVKINKPADQSTQSPPVDFEVEVNGTNFYAELDGQDITSHFTIAAGGIASASLTLQGFPVLAPGSTHRFYTSASLQPQPWQVRDYNDEVQFEMAPLPPLSFSLRGLSVNVGAVKSATVDVPSNVQPPASVTLTPSNANIAVNNQNPGTPETIQSPAASQNFSVEGIQDGTVDITATAPGFTQATLQVRVPKPSFTININPSDLSVVWGSTVTCMVEVTPTYGFKGIVDLETNTLPDGVFASFSQNSLDFSAGPPSLSSALAVDTVEAMCRPEVHTLRIRARARSGSPSKSSNINLAVKRTPGSFIQVPRPLISRNQDCNSDVRGIITGTPNNYSVAFDTPHGNIGGFRSPPLYGFSHGCRIGVVIDENSMPAQPIGFGFVNLGFPLVTGVRDLPGSIVEISDSWRYFYFSQDESLVIICGETSGQPNRRQVSVWDLIEERQIGGLQVFDGTPGGAWLNDVSAPTHPDMVVFTYTGLTGQTRELTWPAP